MLFPLLAVILNSLRAATDTERCNSCQLTGQIQPQRNYTTEESRQGLDCRTLAIASDFASPARFILWLGPFHSWLGHWNLRPRPEKFWPGPQNLGFKPLKLQFRPPLRDSICRWQPFHVLGVIDAGSLMLYKSQMTGQTIVGLQYGCII